MRVSKPSPDEVASTEFHSLKLLRAETGIEYAHRMGVRSVPCRRSVRSRLKLTTGLLVPAKITLSAQRPKAPLRKNRADAHDPLFGELAQRQCDAPVIR